MDVKPLVNARDEDPLPSAPKLVSLPDELLTLIVGELDWKSIVRLRQTCRLLKAMSCRREVWLIVLKRCLATAFPQPFYLKKPLEQCLGADIEDAVVNWEAGWPTTGAVPTKSCVFDVDREQSALSQPGIAKATQSAVRLLPGARFLLSGYSDGTVRYFDLEEESDNGLIPKLLIASPFQDQEGEQKRYSVHIALDYRSEPLAHASNEAHCISAFNIATIVSDKFNIWRVEVEPDSHERSKLALRATAHLSSFIEPHDPVRGFDSLGTHLAYSVVRDTLPESCITVINWKEANRKPREQAEKIERYVLPQIVAQDLTLLPNGNILVADHEMETTVQLYSWLTEGHVSTLTSDKQQLEQVTPRWRHTFSNLNPRAISPPAIISDEVRMLIPDDTGLHTLFIPLNIFSSPRLESFQEISGEFGRQGRVQVFGYHRAVDFDLRNPKNCRAAQYSWPDEKQSRSFRFLKVDHDPSKTGVSRILRPMFDQFSNTAVYTDFSLTRIVKVQLLMHD